MILRWLTNIVGRCWGPYIRLGGLYFTVDNAKTGDKDYIG